MLIEGKIDDKNSVSREILVFIDQVNKDVGGGAGCGGYTETKTLVLRRDSKVSCIKPVLALMTEKIQFINCVLQLII